MHSQVNPHKPLEAGEQSMAHICPVLGWSILHGNTEESGQDYIPRVQFIAVSPLNGNALNMRCSVPGNLVSLSGHYERVF